MAKVYVVVENGELYKNLYSTYESARKAVTTKYAAELRQEWEEVKEMNDPDYQMASRIVDENKDETDDDGQCQVKANSSTRFSGRN